jgi:hypothetical protein
MHDRILQGPQGRYHVQASASAVGKIQQPFSAQRLHVFGDRANARDSEVLANLAERWGRLARGPMAFDHSEHGVLALGRFKIHR